LKSICPKPGTGRVRVLKSSVLPTPRRNMSLPWLPV
jgi:hypothetical protein